MLGQGLTGPPTVGRGLGTDVGVRRITRASAAPPFFAQVLVQLAFLIFARAMVYWSLKSKTSFKKK
jgi:hypothetical protein